ncbi:hypothetical protein [Yersinia proxima]|uniref:hypothetical protein n=1 Tax=Yersinia proxima TaxID=2890316 RepID=UPI001D11ED53|nr:hypothetical protein [Yersinia proxima]
MQQPLEKHVEINDELLDRLRIGDLLSEMEFFRYIKVIDSINDLPVQSYLYAMAYAAYGKKDKAIPFFEEALKYKVDIAPNNYVAYLNNYGTFSEVKDVATRAARVIADKSLCFTAYQSCIFSGDLECAKFFAERYIKITDVNDAEEMRLDFSQVMAQISYFKERVGLSNDDFQSIAETVISVAEEYQKKMLGIDFHTIIEECSYSYVVILKCNEPEILADMNIELAFSLADKDQLTDKRFSAWFKGLTGGENACNV